MSETFDLLMTKSDLCQAGAGRKCPRIACSITCAMIESAIVYELLDNVCAIL